MNKRILIVADDERLVHLLRDTLGHEQFDVECSETGRDVNPIIRRFVPDLVLLDVLRSNGLCGFDLCRSIANRPLRTPIIILSELGEKEDRVRGLTNGADDYLVKPFSIEELLARIHAVLRRTKPRVDEIRLGNVTINFRKLRAFKGKNELLLSDREFELLRYLAEREGGIVAREDLLRVVWGYQQVPQTRTVDNFVFRLRQKIEVDPHNPKYLRKAYGDGYRLMT